MKCSNPSYINTLPRNIWKCILFCFNFPFHVTQLIMFIQFKWAEKIFYPDCFIDFINA